MKPRDRQLAAIRREIPDRIPIDAINVEDTVALHDAARKFRAEGYTRGAA